MLVADLPPVPAQETPIVWVQTMPRFGEDGARLDGVRNEATCGAMPVGYCALRGLDGVRNEATCGAMPVGYCALRGLGLSNGAAQGNTPDTPTNPSLPVGTTLSALLLGRLRRTGYGSWSPLFDSAQVPAPVPQFAIAANAKLENPAFDGGTGWTTEGDVAFANGPSSGFGTGAATLTETGASPRRAQ